MKSPIYLDYAATTPLDLRVAEKMMKYLTADDLFGNSSSTHLFGQVAKAAIEEARQQAADLIYADPSEIIWTSGATEADNLALKGAAALYQRQGRHIVTVKTEHQAVLDTCQQLEKQGYLVTYLSPESNGLLDFDKFQHALREDTILVSVMHVNNELGVIQDIQAIAEMTSARGIICHVDAAQSVGKIPLNVQQTPVDLISFCAHKLYGPKGIGALYVRKKPRVRVAAQIHGGGQEQGMRSGTLATHQIVGMGEACYLAQQHMTDDYKKIQALHDNFFQQINGLVYAVNGDRLHAVPYIINLRFAGIAAEQLMNALPEMAFSTGSACNSKGEEPSLILRALGQTKTEALAGVRFSFGRFTTQEELMVATKMLIEAVKSLS